MAEMTNVIQCPRRELAAGAFPYKGRWADDFFRKPLPIVLELGCGRGEYTVDLAAADPGSAFIGIDIKGARMYTGASLALQRELHNAAFLRTQCELLEEFFAPAEVSDIWITFPDPQMKKVNKRLTSARFLEAYRRILRPGGTVTLKTDSPFLYEFTSRIIALNHLPLLKDSRDLYADSPGPENKTAGDTAEEICSDKDRFDTAIQTAYERQWLSRGKAIKLLRFTLPGDAPIINPEESDIEKDDYRAYPRGIKTPSHKKC